MPPAKTAANLVAYPGVVVDASVWVAQLLPQDLFHAPSHTWLVDQRQQGVELLAPGILLAEVAGAISRRTGQPALAHSAVQTLERLPELRLVAIDRQLARLAARLAADLGLRGADAIYVALAAHLRLPLATLDQEQQTKAAPAVPELITFLG